MPMKVGDVVRLVNDEMGTQSIESRIRGLWSPEQFSSRLTGRLPRLSLSMTKGLYYP